MAGRLWVARLVISGRTAEKLSSCHHLDADEIVDAVQCVAGLRYVWDDDLERGRRALVKVEIRGRDVLVVIYPSELDPWGETFRLGSAYPR